MLFDVSDLFSRKNQKYLCITNCEPVKVKTPIIAQAGEFAKARQEKCQPDTTEQSQFSLLMDIFFK